MKQVAGIIGAGPAGLTAALELLKHTQIKPILFEKSSAIGGLSQTVNYKGNRIDIGGHRFFSKSDEVMQFWLDILPQESSVPSDKVMLLRNRLSRILFLRQFFAYPLSLKAATLKKLGFTRTMKIGTSYLKSQLCPVRPEETLADFFINRFGRELYELFFKDYTEKVWGVPCREIPRDWGAQRVKGLSVGKAVYHALKKFFSSPSTLAQKEIETSLIEQFLYPKFGPGQLWEEAANKVKQQGGQILLDHHVIAAECVDKQVRKITARNEITGEIIELSVDFLLSSMPVQDLIKALTGDQVPTEVQRVAQGLMYRDFITIGVLLPCEKYELLPDNWIYIQERDVKVGRIQVFNNWSPFLVRDSSTSWLGLEYFCQAGDALWNKSDEDLKKLAAQELKSIGFIKECDDVLDSTVIRMEKAYPAYFGSYHEFTIVRDYVDKISNLFLIGRNGMHRYNNMDHSMLTAMKAVEIIESGSQVKDSIWLVNAEEEYHEQR